MWEVLEALLVIVGSCVLFVIFFIWLPYKLVMAFVNLCVWIYGFVEDLKAAKQQAKRERQARRQQAAQERQARRQQAAREQQARRQQAVAEKRRLEEQAAAEERRRLEAAQRQQRRRVLEAQFAGETSLPGDLGSWNVSVRPDMSRMFADYAGTGELNLCSWDTSKASDMSYMFSGAKKLQSLNLENWDVSGVKDMSGMFRGCENLRTLDLSTWDNSSMQNAIGMFEGCDSLREVKVGRGFSFDHGCSLPFEVTVPDRGDGVTVERCWWQDSSGRVYKSQKDLRSNVATTYRRISTFGQPALRVDISAGTTRSARLGLARRAA